MRRFQVLSCFLVVITLTGCPYPQNKRQQLDQLPAHIQQVQSEVDEYWKNEKVLPYLYKEEEEKFTTNYLVNFRVLSQIPPTAYEKGGTYLYVITDIENDPTVRVFDMRINEKVSEVQVRVNEYVKTKGKLPGQKNGAYFPLAFEQLGMDPISLPSPYFPNQEIGWLLDAKGRIYLDYRADAMRMVQSSQEKPTSDQDLRLWMSKQSLYVPAFSPPMKYSQENEPIFSS